MALEFYAAMVNRATTEIVYRRRETDDGQCQEESHRGITIQVDGQSGLRHLRGSPRNDYGAAQSTAIVEGGSRAQIRRSDRAITVSAVLRRPSLQKPR